MSESRFQAIAPDRRAPEIPRIGVGMLGYSFMGKAHSNAWHRIATMMDPPPAIPELIALCGRDQAAVAAAATRYGYAGYYTDWRDLLADDRIQLFDNGGPNHLHAEPCIQAAAAGKHLLCEKPLARTAAEAWTMLEAAERAGLRHMVAFNYRFVPAIMQARYLLEQGALGRIYHFRAQYLQQWLTPAFGRQMAWRLRRDEAGSGALGDLGSHIIDLARFLVGEITRVAAMTRTFTPERPDASGRLHPVDVDDAFVACVEFDNGALGTLEATRYATGRHNGNCFEINGEKGALRFDLERLNELEVHWVDAAPRETRGVTNVLVSERFHPFWQHWWPPGHIIGWEHTFVHELAYFLECIITDRDVAPYGASFLDGYRNAVVCDAILHSAATGRQVDIALD